MLRMSLRAIVVLGFAIRCIAEQAPAAATAAWLTSYDDARVLATKQGKPLLIDFSAEWCSWCKKLDSEVYGDPRVAKALSAFVCVKVDLDTDPRTAMAFQAQSIPRIIVINTYDEVVLDTIGYREADEFLKNLNEALANAKTKTNLNKAPKLQDKPPAPEHVVAEAAKTGSPDRLVALLADPDPKTRAAAEEALSGLGEATTSSLVKALGSDYLGERIAAITLLRKQAVKGPEFDPWASKSDRAKAVADWMSWLRDHPVAAQAPKVPDAKTP